MQSTKMFQFAEERGEFNAIMLSLLGHGGSEFFSQLGFEIDQIGLGYTQLVAAIISQGQRDGEILIHTPPEILAMFFFGLFNGLNLTYGQDWLQLPKEYLLSTVYRNFGFQE